MSYNPFMPQDPEYSVDYCKKTFGHIFAKREKKCTRYSDLMSSSMNLQTKTASNTDFLGDGSTEPPLRTQFSSDNDQSKGTKSTPGGVSGSLSGESNPYQDLDSARVSPNFAAPTQQLMSSSMSNQTKGVSNTDWSGDGFTKPTAESYFKPVPMSESWKNPKTYKLPPKWNRFTSFGKTIEAKSTGENSRATEKKIVATVEESTEEYW